MQRIKRSTAVAVLPADPAGGTPGYFPLPNPGGGVPAAVPGYEWYNNVQEEICAVISAAGIALDGANRAQMLAAIQQLIASGGATKTPVRAATTANITLAGGAPSTLDGVALAANDRILVKDQTTASQNGLYVVTTLGTGANGTWTRATDADGAGELFAGLLVVSVEGTANADAVWELATDGAITIGTTALVFSRKDGGASGAVQGAFKNLQASATGLSANVSVTADEIAVESAANAYQILRSVNLTIAGTSSGAANGLDTGALAINSWYSVWVIWNGTTTAGLLSLSATAPTLPSGYTHKARVGWIRTDGTGNKYPLSFLQMGRRVQYKVAAGTNVTALPVMASGIQGGPAVPTYVAVSVSAFVPPTAAAIRLRANDGYATGSGIILIAPSNAYGALGSANQPPVVLQLQNNNSQLAELLLESTNIYYASGESSARCDCFGWEDNL